MLTIAGYTSTVPTSAAHTKTEVTGREMTPSEGAEVYEYWFKEASKPMGDITNEWKCLTHENNFNEFVNLLNQLSEPGLAKKVLAADVVKVIQSVIKLPLIRELVFKALSNTNEPIFDKYTKIQGYVKFGELCQSWYSKAGKPIEDLPEKWESLKGNEKFAGFTALLKRLDENKLKLRIKATEVVEVIQCVIESPSIRTLIFNESYAASANCQSRPLSIFLRAQGYALFGKLEREGATPQKLLTLAIRIVKQDLIDDAVFEVLESQWQDIETTGGNYERRLKGNTDDTGPYAEEALEYQLALCDALGKELNLPFYAKSIHMDFCIKQKTMAKLTEEDLLIAKNYVNAIVKNQDSLVQRLITHPVWKNYMSEYYKNDFLIIEKRYGTLSSQLEDKYPLESTLNSEYKTELLKIVRDYKQEINTLLKSKTRQLCKESAQGCTLL